MSRGTYKNVYFSGKRDFAMCWLGSVSANRGFSINGDSCMWL